MSVKCSYEGTVAIICSILAHSCLNEDTGWTPGYILLDHRRNI